MTCREFAAFILDYREGNVMPAVRARFEDHLTRCPACVNYLAAYELSVALGRDAFEDEDLSVEQVGVPESLVTGILSALRAARSS